MAFHVFPSASARPAIAIAPEPIYSALNSMALLGRAERLPALDAWVIRTAAAFTPEQIRDNRLIFDYLVDALLPERDWPDVPAYLADLAAQTGEQLRERVWLPEAPGEDQELWNAAQALLDDPAALREMIVSHVRTIWETALAPEWRRALPPIQKTVATFSHRAAADQAAMADNLRIFIAGDAQFEPGVEQIICVPSPHVGRYVTRLLHHGTLRLFFHGPSSYPVVMRTSQVERDELHIRLAGLADEARLDILALFAERNELSAQEIMARLNLSQPSVSRQLKQLTPYVVERRGEGASKLYSLAAPQLDLTFRALKQLVTGDLAELAEPEQAPADYPRELRRFLDAQGRATAWPTKRRDQLLLLEFLASKFDFDRDYTEKEVNAVLVEHMHPIFKDYAIIRRELYNYRYLDRERDGSRYWRLARPAPGGDTSDPADTNSLSENDDDGTLRA
jgi:DNA-binding transcriptional ArsR family regulator